MKLSDAKFAGTACGGSSDSRAVRLSNAARLKDVNCTRCLQVLKKLAQPAKE